jgi:hypothetical protein
MDCDIFSMAVTQWGRSPLGWARNTDLVDSILPDSRLLNKVLVSKNKSLVYQSLMVEEW